MEAVITVYLFPFMVKVYTNVSQIFIYKYYCYNEFKPNLINL